MKYLLVILALIALVWLLRSARRRADAPPPPAAPRAPAGGSAQPIVACQHCGLHLPRGEALPGRGGVFCGEAHRAEYERQHPDA